MRLDKSRIAARTVPGNIRNWRRIFPERNKATPWAKKAKATAKLLAYKADGTHFSDWCTVHGFVPIPAAPATDGAYLASLADSHEPATIRRRLSALGKMHRFNDLTWNPAHRDV